MDRNAFISRPRPRTHNSGNVLRSSRGYSGLRLGRAAGLRYVFSPSCRYLPPHSDLVSCLCSVGCRFPRDHLCCVTCVAYIANQFPSPVEPYVIDEIRELRVRGICVIPCSARRPQIHRSEPTPTRLIEGTMYLQPFRVGALLQALWLSWRGLRCLGSL